MTRKQPRRGDAGSAPDAPPAGAATWTYCVVRAAGPPPAAAAPPGPPGASPARAVPLGPELWLIVSDVPLPAYAAAAIESRLADLGWVSDRALPHEAVIEHFAGAGAVVPLPLFTLFADDARAREAIAAQRPRLEEALERVAGCSEWGLKVFLASGPDATAAPARPASSGTEFLERKRGARVAARERASRARGLAEELADALTGAAVDAVHKPPPVPETGARLLLEAAFLVRDADAGAFEELVAARAGALCDAGCRVTLTGPWPPFHFVGEEPR
jgi:hypothetical protein